MSGKGQAKLPLALLQNAIALPHVLHSEIGQPRPRLRPSLKHKPHQVLRNGCSVNSAPHLTPICPICWFIITEPPRGGLYLISSVLFPLTTSTSGKMEVTGKKTGCCFGRDDESVCVYLCVCVCVCVCVCEQLTVASWLSPKQIPPLFFFFFFGLTSRDDEKNQHFGDGWLTFLKGAVRCFGEEVLRLSLNKQTLFVFMTE